MNFYKLLTDVAPKSNSYSETKPVSPTLHDRLDGDPVRFQRKGLC